MDFLLLLEGLFVCLFYGRTSNSDYLVTIAKGC